MKRIRRPTVGFIFGIKGKQVYLKIDCPDHVTAGRYMAKIESWLLGDWVHGDLTNSQIDKEYGNGTD